VTKLNKALDAMPDTPVTSGLQAGIIGGVSVMRQLFVSWLEYLESPFADSIQLSIAIPLRKQRRVFCFVDYRESASAFSNS
jgi:hypothetical protein